MYINGVLNKNKINMEIIEQAKKYRDIDDC